MKILLIILFLPITIYAQKKWYGIQKNDYWMMAAQAAAGGSDAANQLIQFGRVGKGSQFWDYSISWKNKYKDWDAGDKRPAFFGSTTAFVWVTDGYHLTRRFERMFNLMSFGFSMEDLYQYDKKDRWKVVVKKVLLASAANRLMFNILYQAKYKN